MRIGGRVVTVNVANPAAGAEWTYTVPPGVVRLLVGACWLLTTSATVANRGVMVELADGANDLLGRWGGNWPEPANSVVNYSLPAPIAGQVDATGLTTVLIPVPRGLMFAAGWVIRSKTTNLQAADQHSRVFLQFEEWDQ